MTELARGIQILQGPPGTGKTHTLLGIVSALYNHIRLAKDNYKKYIMICTPSNCAIDEIIVRLKINGLYGSTEKNIKPKIVRVGILDKNSSDIVKKTSLDYIVSKYIYKKERMIVDEDAIKKELKRIRDKMNKIDLEIE